MSWDIEEFIWSSRLSDSTKEVYSSDLCAFKSFCEDRSIESYTRIGRKTIQAFVTYLIQGGNSRRTASRKLSAIRSYFNYLVRCGLLDENPAAGLSIGRIERKLPMVLSRADAARLMTVQQKGGDLDFLIQRDNSICELLYGSGLRVSELVGLDVDDCDLERGVVRVMGKGSKERIVPMNKICTQTLQRYITTARQVMIDHLGSKFGGSNSALFYNKVGLRIGTRDVRRILDSRSDNPVYPHALRHTFATHLLDGGADLRVIQELLGHSRITSTQVYTQVSKDQLIRVHENTHPRGR